LPGAEGAAVAADEGQESGGRVEVRAGHGAPLSRGGG
jgi:hypothetical protein